MASPGLVLLKLGGSLLTFKARPLSFNAEATRSVCRALQSLRKPLVIVHGGGSFGHFFAAKHNISRSLTKASPLGVAEVKTAMMDLHLRLLTSLQDAGLAPFSLPPVSLLENAGMRSSAARLLNRLVDSQMVPVTYGDVLQTRGGFRIVSGDTLMFELARILRPAKALFALDVDGIYEDAGLTRGPLNELPAGAKGFRYLLRGVRSRTSDATGGILFKVREARRIASLGIDAYFVNGLKPERLVKAINDGVLEGTLIKGRTRD